jgi:hypothetical protein
MQRGGNIAWQRRRHGHVGFGSVASCGDRLAEDVVRKQTLSQARMPSSKPRRSNPNLRPAVMTRYPSKRSAPRKGAVSQWETVPPGKGRSSR